MDVHTSTELPSHLSFDSSNYAEVMASFNIWSPLEECEEFLDRLDAYYSLSLSRYSSTNSSAPVYMIQHEAKPRSPHSPPVTFPLSTCNRPYFIPNSSIYNLFAVSDSSGCPEAHFTKDSPILAICAIILHTTLYELRDSPCTTANYLDNFSSDFEEEGLQLGSEGSAQSLLWMLLTHSQTFTWTDSSTDKPCRSRLDILPLSAPCKDGTETVCRGLVCGQRVIGGGFNRGFEDGDRK
jgi:hypothetical protein